MSTQKRHPGKMQKKRRPARAQQPEQAGNTFPRTAVRQIAPENVADKKPASFPRESPSLSFSRSGPSVGIAGKREAKSRQAGKQMGQIASMLSVSGKKPGADDFEVIAGRIKGAPANYRQKISDFQRHHTPRQMNALQDRILGPTTGARLRKQGQNGAQIMRKKGKNAKTTNAPKLSKKTLKGPTTTKHGGFSWVIQWHLDKKSKAGGWIVQKVRANFDVKDDKDAPVDIKARSGVDPSWWTMWEAWPVKPGKKVTTYASDSSDPEDDTYGLPGHGANTKGKQEVLGDAEFYEGVSLPSSFKVTNKAPAWILPTTKADPGMSGGSGTIPHNLTATWDSVKGDGTTATAIA